MNKLKRLVQKSGRVSRSFDGMTIQSIRRAERWKAYLENKGYAVTTVPHGLCGVIISGVDKGDVR